MSTRPTVPHSTSVHERLIGRFGAYCSCGRWTESFPTPEEATAAGDEHVREESEKA